MRHLRENDVLVITRLDRLGRSVKHLAALAVELQDREVGLRVLQQGIGTTTAVGRLFFHILAAIAEFERELIVERTQDGLDASRARGRNGGRKSTLTAAAIRQIQAMYDSGEHTVEQIAAAFKTTRPTIYRARQERHERKRGLMPAGAPTILATSMGFDRTGRNPTDWRPGPVFTEAFRLAGEPDRPRLCFLATAGGDPLTRIAGFHGAFAGTDVRATHLTLFEMPNVDDVREHCSPRT